MLACFLFACGNAPESTPDSSNTSGTSEVSSEVISKDYSSYNIKLHQYHTESLPRVDINTENGIALDDKSLELGMNKGMNHEIMEYDYAKCSVTLTDGEKTDLNDVSGKVKIRGNYTSTYPKRPLRIKFDKKQNMGGLNDGQKFKNWVLLAEYRDESLAKNSLTDYLGKTMLGSDGEYCADFRYVEVYLNGQYNGLYTLTEQQEAKEGRVNITEAKDPEDYPDLSEEELSDPHIGYFFEYDGYYSNEDPSCTFTLNYPANQTDLANKPITYLQDGYTIKSDVFYARQRDYIKKVSENILLLVDDAINKDHGSTPYYALNDNGDLVRDSSIKDSRTAVSNVIDIDSLLDMFFIQEIAEDGDLDWSSFYLYFDAGEHGDHKIHYCAPWDFDGGYGESQSSQDKAFYSMNCLQSGGAKSVMHNNANPWLISFAHADWFWKEAKDKWEAHKWAGTFEGASKMLEDYKETFADAYTKNRQKWTSTTEGGTTKGEGNNQQQSSSEEATKGEPGSQDSQGGEPGSKGEPGSQDSQGGEPGSKGEPGSQDSQGGEPGSKGEPGSQDSQGGEPGSKGGEPGSQDSQSNNNQGGDTSKNGGSSSTSALDSLLRTFQNRVSTLDELFKAIK